MNVGRLGKISLGGKYAYVGSNQRGGRIERHLRKGKTRKWHIDYLTEAGRVEEILTMPLGKESEVELARELSPPAVKNFGSSDSKDMGHLFKVSPGLMDKIQRFADKRGVTVSSWHREPGRFP